MEALYHNPIPVATPFSKSRTTAKRMAGSDGILVEMSDTGQFSGYGVFNLADYVRMKYIFPMVRGR